MAIISSGLISGAAGLAIGGTGIYSHGSSLTLSGTLSSSGGATFLGKVIAEDVSISGTLTTAGAFSPSSMSGNVKINVNNPIFSNGLNVSGASVYAAPLSSSAGATFVAGVIANTIEASSSVFVGGALGVSASAIITGSTTLHGVLSSSYGATFTEGVIASTLEASSSVFVGGALGVSASATITGSTTLHGALSSSYGATFTETVILSNAAALTLSGTISSSGGATFLGKVIAEDVNVSGTLTAAAFAPDVISGSVTINVLDTATFINPVSIVTSGTVEAAGLISASAGLLVGGEATFSNAGLTAFSGSIETIGDISSSAGNLIIGGSSMISNNLTVSGAISSSAGALIIGGGTTISNVLSVSGTTTFANHVLPAADDSHDLGSAAKRWRNIYTGDLHLQNDRGHWVVIEEDKYLSIRNQKTGQRYKLLMELLPADDWDPDNSWEG